MIQVCHINHDPDPHSLIFCNSSTSSVHIICFIYSTAYFNFLGFVYCSSYALGRICLLRRSDRETSDIWNISIVSYARCGYIMTLQGLPFFKQVDQPLRVMLVLRFYKEEDDCRWISRGGILSFALSPPLRVTSLTLKNYFKVNANFPGKEATLCLKIYSSRPL